MSSSRYAISVRIPNYLISLPRWEEYLENIKHRMRTDLGTVVLEAIEKNKTAMVIKLTWQVSDSQDGLDYQLALVANMNQVDSIRIGTREFMPLTYKMLDNADLLIEWQCDACGQVNVVDKNTECKRCGTPRVIVK